MLFRRQGLLWLGLAVHILRLQFVKNLSLLLFSSFAIFVICKIGWYHYECTMSAKISTGLE